MNFLTNLTHTYNPLPPDGNAQTICKDFQGKKIFNTGLTFNIFVIKALNSATNLISIYGAAYDIHSLRYIVQVELVN